MVTKPILEVSNISKHYGNFTALQDVNLKIEKGSIFGLLGPNGAGKTTLIRILTQIYQADKGDIYFEGAAHNANNLNRIGYLPEERGLYKKMFVEEHLLYLGKLRGLEKHSLKEKIDFWLAKFKLQERKNDLVGSLSKGNQQKVQFIAALLHDPDFIILDEPFSGFDPINAELLKEEIIAQQKEGKTILYSTHRMESVEELCSSIAFFNKSKCIYTGSVDELKKQFSSNKILATVRKEQAQLEGFERISSTSGCSVLSADTDNQDAKALIEKVNQQFDILKLEQHQPTLHEIFLQLAQ